MKNLENDDGVFQCSFCRKYLPISLISKKKSKNKIKKYCKLCKGD